MRSRGLVILPSFNEEKIIGRIIKQIKRQNLPLDILVVDDGSDDKTTEIAKKEGVDLIRHSKNLGKGRSLRDGFNKAIEGNYDFVITMDSDGQHNPEEIKKFLEKEADADVIVGSRMHKPSGMPFLRKHTNIFMSKIISKMCKKNIPDSQSGYRLIKRKVIETIKLSSRNYDIESELLIKAARAGFVVDWVPIQSIYKKGQVSFINPVTDTFRFARLLIENARK